jgi:hypothetical protein
METDDIERSDPASVDRLTPDRWTLIRDVLVFQVKLLVDGLRDLLLVPLSLIAGVISLLSAGRRPGTEFYDLLRLGRRSERFINLFGAAERLHGSPDSDEQFIATDIDRFADHVEAFVVDEYRRGGVTRQARERLDRAIDRLQQAARRKS